MKELHITDTVAVKLTEFGAKELNKFNAKHNEIIHLLCGAEDEYYPTEYKENQLVEMSLRDLFHRFKGVHFCTNETIPFTILITDYFAKLPKQIRVDGKVYKLYIEYNPGGVEGFGVGYTDDEKKRVGRKTFKPLTLETNKFSSTVELAVLENSFDKACMDLYLNLMICSNAWEGSTIPIELSDTEK